LQSADLELVDGFDAGEIDPVTRSQTNDYRTLGRRRA
jgi:hypothetical protein